MANREYRDPSHTIAVTDLYYSYTNSLLHADNPSFMLFTPKENLPCPQKLQFSKQYSINVIDNILSMMHGTGWYYIVHYNEHMHETIFIVHRRISPAICPN